MASESLPKTRLSLFYLVAYLTTTGLGFLAAPDATLRLLGATGAYDDAFPRFSGVLMIALGVLVSQIVRFRVEVLYPITIIIRLGIFTLVAWIYARSRDPLFVAVLGVVGLGIALTAAGYFAESRRRTAIVTR